MTKNNLNVSRETLQKINKFIKILLLWNNRLNLISRNTESDILERHIIDSLQLSNYLSPDDQILDFGTGAGFPGMVLNIAGYKNITLIDSVRKKCDFLLAVKKELNLSAIIVNDRVETIQKIPCNVITARAVAPLDKLLKLIQPHYNKNVTCWFFKGKTYLDEIAKAEKLWKFNYKSYRSITSAESVILKITDIEWK